MAGITSAYDAVAAAYAAALPDASFESALVRAARPMEKHPQAVLLMARPPALLP